MDTNNSGSDSFGVKAWLNQHFIIDESQSLGIMTPKPVIRMMAREVPQLRHLLVEESGERMFDTIFKKAVVNSLTDEPRLKIDTEAGYHIDQHRSRTTKYRKVRSVRHVFPKHIHSVESELRDTYDRILTRSERAVRNMVAKDNAAMPPLPTRVAEQILTTQTLGNRDAQSRKRRIEVELDTVEGIEILSSNNGQKPQEGRQTPERFNSGDSDDTDDVEEVESVDETHTYDWGPAGPSRARVDSDAPVRRDDLATFSCVERARSDFPLGACLRWSRRDCWKTWPVILSTSLRRAIHPGRWPYKSDLRAPGPLLRYMQAFPSARRELRARPTVRCNFSHVTELLHVRRRRVRFCHPCHKSDSGARRQGT